MRQAPRRSGGRASLDAQLIVRAALALVEREGSEALTFRRLGVELGAAPTAVLRHFRDKDDLLRALGDHLLAEALAAVDGWDGGWRQRILALSDAVRRTFVAHPRIAVLVAARTLDRPAEFAAAEHLIAALLDAGLTGPEAASIYRVVADTALAHAAFEAAVRTLGDTERSGDRAAWLVGYPSLPAGRYPAIHTVAPHLAEVDEQDQLALTLELLLDGVEARLGGRQRGGRR